MKQLSNEQRRNIFRLFKGLGITDDEFRREATEAITGKGSLKELTAQEGIRLIEELMRRAGEAPSESGSAPCSAPRAFRHGAARERRKKTDAITAYQIEQLGIYYEQVGADLAAQKAFNTRQIKRPWPQTVGEAQTVLNSLKAILKRDPDYRMDRKRNA